MSDPDPDITTLLALESMGNLRRAQILDKARSEIQALRAENLEKSEALRKIAWEIAPVAVYLRDSANSPNTAAEVVRLAQYAKRKA